MSIEERQKQTTVNVQEKANLIWAIADKLVGVYKPHEYGNFTARDIINLMTELLVGEDEERLEEEGITATIYDMAMGTSQMLGCMSDRLLEICHDTDCC